MHLVAAEVDPDGSHWTGSLFQPDFHDLDQTEDPSITTGYPRFGTDEKVKVYWIDRGSTIEALAMRIESTFLMGAIPSLAVFPSAAIALALTTF